MRSRPRLDSRVAREQEQFEAIYRLHYPELLRFATARVDPDSARDLVAEVFLVAWRRSGDIPDPARPWLYGVARGVLANHLRSGHRRDLLQQRLTQELQLPHDHDDHRDPHDPHRVLRALASLNDRDQQVLRLIEWDELDAASAAAIAGCSVRTFNVRLHRARRRLALALTALTSATSPVRAGSVTKEIHP